MTDLHQHGLLKLAALLRRRETSSVALTTHLLERIEKHDRRLHSFVTVDTDGVLAAAERADAELDASQHRGLLHGIPVAVKDSLATKGLRTTWNSRVFAEHVPLRDTPAVARLRRAGAVIIGKTNLNEFGWSLPSETDLTPPVRNPWQPEYASVGSSSGSGAAVSAGFATAALGTDGGGSTRLPAAQHGLVGLKPSREAVPREPSLISYLSTVGVLARSAADAGAVYDAIADQPVGPLDRQVSGLRLALPRAYMEQMQVEPDVRDAFETDLRVLAKLGVTVEDVPLPSLDLARAAAFVLIHAASFGDHEELLSTKLDLFGPVTRRYLLAGVAVGGADTMRAREVAERVARDLRSRLAGYAGIISPASPVVTAEAARRPGEHRKGRNAAFTSPFNLTGWPAVAVPSRIGSLGLPIGFQVAAPPGGEKLLLNLAEAYGAATGVRDLTAPF